MVIIERHDFDNMENQNPESVEIVGYASDEEEANEIISKFPKNLYEGYGGTLYPYYRVKLINHISKYEPFERNDYMVHWHDLRKKKLSCSYER